MPSIINTNIHSLSAQRYLNNSQGGLTTSLQRLSSGLRVNSAKDDAAGLAIATRMEAQSRGMNVAMRNANDGISALTTADGALSIVTEMIQRIRELTVQGANGTNTPSDVAALQKEVSALNIGITEIFQNTEFNGQKLLSFSGYTGLNMNTWKAELQIGSNVGETLQVSIFPDAQVDGFGDPVGYPFSAVNGLNLAGGMPRMVFIDADLETISNARATIGAQLNRLDGIVSNLQVANENVLAARGRIVDADYAAETASLTRAQILQQAGTAMLAQANAQPQQVLKLLQQ